MNGRYRKLIALCSLSFSLAIPGWVQAVDEPAPAENRFVLRISREFLRKHLNPAVDESRPIDRILFDAHVTGRSETHGLTTIEMDLSEKEALFTLRLTGSTVNSTVASHPPVAVHSTGTTSFVASRVIRFDGVRFFEDPAAFEASYNSSVNCISVPPGVRGRIAHRRAVQAIACNAPAAEAIAVSETRAAVMADFNRESDRFVKELNGIVPLEKTIALFVPKTRDWINHLSTTRDYLFVSPGPKDAEVPVLPKEYSRMKAPVELWVRGKAEGEQSRRALETWSTLNGALDRFRKKSEKKVEGIKVTAVGEWWVVKIGEDLVEDILDKKD